MNNLLLFLDSFLEYFVTYVIFLVLIIAASLLGIMTRKIKNKKENVEAQAEMVEEK